MPRPKIPDDKKKQDISIKADPILVNEVQAIATRLDMPVSLIGRKLLARGVAAYNRDGSLDEPEESAADLRKRKAS